MYQLNGFDPFWIFQLPGSGNVRQKISSPWFSPALTFNFAGDAAIEERVVADVASYGAQLGWLGEIVQALATGTEPDAKTVARLTRAIDDVKVIKQWYRRSRLDDATEALDKLDQMDPEQHDELISRRYAACNAQRRRTGADGAASH